MTEIVLTTPKLPEMFFTLQTLILFLKYQKRHLSRTSWGKRNVKIIGTNNSRMSVIIYGFDILNKTSTCWLSSYERSIAAVLNKKKKNIKMQQNIEILWLRVIFLLNLLGLYA